MLGGNTSAISSMVLNDLHQRHQPCFVLDSFPRMFVCDQLWHRARIFLPSSSVWYQCEKTMSSSWWRAHLPIIEPKSGFFSWTTNNCKWKSPFESPYGSWGLGVVCELLVAVEVESDKSSSSPWAHGVQADMLALKLRKGSDPTSHVLTEKVEFAQLSSRDH